MAFPKEATQAKKEITTYVNDLAQQYVEEMTEQFVERNGRLPDKKLTEFWLKKGKKESRLTDKFLMKKNAIKAQAQFNRVSALLDLDIENLPDGLLPEHLDEKLKNVSVETLITVAQIKNAIEGDTAAYKELMDRGRGKATQRIEQTLESNVSIQPINWVKEVPDAVEAEVIDDED